MKPATKWNRDVVFYAAVESGFEVEELNETHLRLTRQDGARMDYFPKSSKGCWLGFKKQIFFYIPDIEKYLKEKFK